MTNAELRARELVMEQTATWHDRGLPWFESEARVRAELVREAETAIKAAIEDERG